MERMPQKSVTGLKLKALRRRSTNMSRPMDIIHSDVLTTVLAKCLCSFLFTNTHCLPETNYRAPANSTISLKKKCLYS